MADCFFETDGERFLPTAHTTGPWSPDAQHGGPPSALLLDELLRRHERADAQVTRATFELLGPVPLEPLRVETQVVRPGRRVELLEGVLLGERGALLLARVWRIRRAEGLTVGVSDRARPPSTPDEGDPARGFFQEGDSYGTAMEWRFTTGSWNETGPATCWMRARHPLVAGRGTLPAARVALAADSGNGISNVVPFKEWMYVNPDLSIHLDRDPVGEWVCLDATTTVSDDGVGFATSRLSDESGRIGRSLQSLYVDRL